MKTVGIFEAKTKLSELCEEVAATSEPVTVTRRGKPLVRITPLIENPMSIKERRTVYMAEHAQDEEGNDADFDPPPRSRDTADFVLKE